MPLSASQKRHLRALAHPLRPVVLVGQAGVTAALLREADLALQAHELIKLKISASDRELRDEMIERISEQCGAETVQRIGHTVVLYRPNPKKRQPLVIPPA